MASPESGTSGSTPAKTAKGDNLKTLVETIVASVRHHEEHTKARAAAWREADGTDHVRRIEAVVCNLADAILLPPPTGRIADEVGEEHYVLLPL